MLRLPISGSSLCRQEMADPRHPLISSPADLPLAQELSGTGQYEVTESGCRFTILPGETTAKWRIPCHSEMQVDFSFRATFRARHALLLPGMKHAVAVLRDRDGNDSEVPLYKAAAGDDSAFVSRQFSTREPVRSLVGIDIQLAAAGDQGAALDIENLQLLFSGNLPHENPEIDHSAYEAHQVAWTPLGTPLVRRAGKGVAEFAFLRIAFGEAESCWPHADYFDYARLDHALDAVADSAKIIVFDFTRQPRWWPHHRYGDLEGATRGYWRTAMQHVLRHLATTEHAASIAGATALVSGEENCAPPVYRTNSPDAIDAFRTWLKEKYGTDEALAAAWNREVVFEAARPNNRWPAGSWGPIIWQEKASEAGDNRRFYAESWAGSLNWIAAQIKELTGKRLLAGVSGGPAYHLSPHLANSATALTAAAGTAQITSADFYHVRQIPEENQPLLTLLDGEPLTMRSAQHAAVDGLRLASLVDLRTPQSLRRILSSVRRSQSAEIALVRPAGLPFSLHAPARTASATLAGELLRTPQRLRGSLLGAPVDVVEIGDLMERDYRMILVLSSLSLSGEERAILHSLENGGRTLVYGWCTGMLSEEGLNPVGASELARQTIRVVTEPRPARLSYGGKQDFIWRTAGGTALQLAPAPVVIETADVEVMARYAGTNEAALAVRHFHGFSTVYSALPFVPAAWLRRLAEASGVHFYADIGTDVTVLDELIAVRAREDRVIELNLPQAESLFELVSRRALPPARQQRLQGRLWDAFLLRRGIVTAE